MEKKRKGKINDILNYNIKDSEIYDIECIEKAKGLMTSIQKDYYMHNDVSIILQGKVIDIKNGNNNIEITIRGKRFDSIVFCEFNKDSNLINIDKEQFIKIKGYLKLNDKFIRDSFIKLKDCKLV
ncbi:hypothetical protein [Tissierella carlieri]|nr:hypothetical protein [Tissierella carlieri]